MDCYDEILEIEAKQESSQMYKYLNKLAKCPKKGDIQNCIILLLSLMNEDKIDIYHSRGKFHTELNQEERTEMLKICKSIYS